MASREERMAQMEWISARIMVEENAVETHDLHAWSWIDAYPLIDTGSGKGFNRGDLSPFVGTIAITLATRDADLSVESRSAEKPGERRLFSTSASTTFLFHFDRPCSGGTGSRRTEFQPSQSRILLPERDRTSTSLLLDHVLYIGGIRVSSPTHFSPRLPARLIFLRIFDRHFARALISKSKENFERFVFVFL